MSAPAVEARGGARVSRVTGRFTALVPVGHPASGPSLLSLARALVPAGQDADIRPLHVASGERFRDAADSAKEALGPLLASLAAAQPRPEPIVRTGPDVAAGIVDAAEELDAQLIVLGWQRPVLDRKRVGGTVASVMARTRAMVTMLHDRRPRPWRRVLVPFLCGAHDHAAIAAAHRLSREIDLVTVLHVVEPGEDAGSGGRLRTSLAVDCELKIVPAPDPTAAVLLEARTGGYDAIVIGASRPWGRGSAFLGVRHEQLARDTGAAMLIVKAAAA